MEVRGLLHVQSRVLVCMQSMAMLRCSVSYLGGRVLIDHLLHRRRSVTGKFGVVALRPSQEFDGEVLRQALPTKLHTSAGMGGWCNHALRPLQECSGQVAAGHSVAPSPVWDGSYRVARGDVSSGNAGRRRLNTVAGVRSVVM